MKPHGDVLVVEEHEGRRMPVVDESGALVGIVTLDDLLALLAEEELDGLAQLEACEQQKEQRSRP